MTSTDQQPQPDSRKYGSIKSKGRNGGVGERQMTGAARRACWLAGWVVGSSDLWQQTQRSLFLSASVFGNNERGGKSVRYCVSYWQLFCLEGRQCVFIFARWLSDICLIWKVH